MHLAIIGSRNFNDFEIADAWYLRYFAYYKPHYIVSGGANGADKIGKQIASKYNIEYLEFKPDWDRYGKSAGMRRNVDIIDNCDMVLAFWNGASKGTANSLGIAKKQKKTTIIVYF